MHIDHDSALAIDEAVWLVNSDDVRTGIDSLTTPQALEAWVIERGISGERMGSESELRAVHRLRRRVRQIFDLANAGQNDAVISAINDLIADARALPQLVEHDGSPIHLHFTPSNAPIDQRLGAELAIAFAILVRDGGVDRLRVCASPDCGRVLVDLSKNRSRRYCDTQCGNRQHVAAYRQRHAAAQR